MSTSCREYPMALCWFYHQYKLYVLCGWPIICVEMLFNAKYVLCGLRCTLAQNILQMGIIHVSIHDVWQFIRDGFYSSQEMGWAGLTRLRALPWRFKTVTDSINLWWFFVNRHRGQSMTLNPWRSQNHHKIYIVTVFWWSMTENFHHGLTGFL